MFKKLTVCFLDLVLFFFCAAESVAYVPETTHAALTQEVIEFYNLLHPDKKITAEEAEWIIQGSIDEDRDIRAINHFYDPINNIGWTGKGLGGFTASEVRGFTSAFVAPEGTDTVSAVRWVNERNLQSQYYSRYGGDRTWTQALEYFYGGKKEEAYYTLGHVLHLLEDMAVPAHTRDDPHPPVGDEESPHEAYADQRWNRSSINDLDIPNRLVKEGVVLPSESSIEGYLHSIALYSNRYFFSKDTINDLAYDLRVSKNNCDDSFCYSADKKGIRIPLVKVRKTKNGLKYETTYLIEKSDNYIFNAYFSRLAEKSVLYGAAVIDHFHNEARDYIPSRITRFNEKSSLGRTVGGRFSLAGELSLLRNRFVSFFANIGDSIADIFSNSPEIEIVELPIREAIQEEQEVEEFEALIPESEELTVAELKNQQDDEFDRLSELNEQQEEQLIIVEEGKENEQEEELENIVPDSVEATSTVVQGQSVQAEAQTCSFGDSTPQLSSGQVGSIIINEVAWMGTTVSVNDEWIELKNTSTSQVDVSGYQLLDKAEQIKVAFESGTKIPAGGFYLLERTNDETISGIAADKIYVGALSNTDEGLRLFNSECGLVDEVIASPNWPAGSNSSKGTMERKSDLAWQSSIAWGGTPKTENSVPTQFAGGGGGSVSTNETSSSEEESETPSSSTSTASAVNHVLISEIQVAGVDVGDEFIELYNPTAAAVDMSGWSVQYVSGKAEVSTSTVSKKNFLATSTIEAQEFFLIARNTDIGGIDGYVGSVSADIGHRTFSLSGISTGAKIFLVSNKEEVESVADTDIVDMIDYSFSVPDSGESLERKAFENDVCFSAQSGGEFSGNGCDTDSDNDFETRSVSRSQGSESSPEPRNAPTAVANFSVGYHFSKPTVTMNWGESQDYTGATSTISYEIEEINTPTSSTPFEFNATSTALEQAIDEIGRDYQFTIKAVDADGLTSNSTVASTTVPSFVDNFYFYRHPDASSTEYLIESYYQSYPFVSDSYNRGDTWKILVFYHNAEAAKGEPLSTGSSWNLTDLKDVISIKYKECSSGSLATNFRMILPDTAERCGVGGGLSNNARIWSDFEDNHLLVRSASSTDDVIFEENEDYITIAFYSLSDSGGGSQTLSLVAVDKTKYYFQDSVLFHQSPTMPSGLAIDSYTVNSPTSTAQVSWNFSTDTDSLDDNISYELSWDNMDWESLTLTSGANSSKRYANLYAALGSTSTVHIRAVDDFNTTSTFATTTLVLPTAVVDTNPDPSNSYFAVDEARVDGSLLKIKWRLITTPDTNRAFGIIPFLSASGTPASLDNYRSLHRDYDGDSGFPLAAARMSSQCSTAITPIEDYTLGWRYETRFSTIGGVPVSDALIGQDLEFTLYTRNHLNEPTCNIGDAVNSPFFTGHPVTVTN